MVEVLVATMNRKSKDQLIKKMNIKGNALVINQVTKDEIELVNEKEAAQKIYSFREKGLSKSRNKAIQNASSDICVIADDDLTYLDNYEQIISEAYDKYKDADIIAFYVESKTEDRPTTMQKEGKVGFLNSMKISSFQITFKRASIIKKNISFDTNFGAGSGKYTMGEENIFLFDCLKKGLKIYFVPQTIATVKHEDSTWYNGFNKELLVSKGAMFYRMSNIFSDILILQFAVRKYKYYKNNMGFIQALRYMFKGRKQVRCRVFMIGDFINNTGPAIVNKNFRKCLPKNTLYSDSQNKLFRIIELFAKTLICDALCFCSFSKLNVIGIKLAKLVNKKTFYIMHGCIDLENRINGNVSEEYSQCEEFILNSINKVFCVSEQLKNEMSSKGYNTEFDYIYNGIDWDLIGSNNSKRREMQIMSTGGGIPLKNNLIVCEAIKKLNIEKKLKLKYILAGKGCGNEPQILAYDFVEYHESLPYEKCMEKMAESKIYIQNSEYETFGLAVIEALANGCDLLVSSRVGAIGIIKDINKGDIIYNPKDVDEIAAKIENIIEKSNNKRLLSSIDRESTDIKYRAYELLEKIGKEL